MGGGKSGVQAVENEREKRRDHGESQEPRLHWVQSPAEHSREQLDVVLHNGPEGPPYVSLICCWESEKGVLVVKGRKV